MITALALAVAYTLVGIVLLVVGFVVLDVLTPGRLGERIYRDRSPNAALVTSALDLSLGAIMFTSIWSNADGWAGLGWALVFGVAGIALQVLTFLVIDALTPGSLREIVVSDGFHPGSLVAAANMLAVGAIVCASIA